MIGIILGSPPVDSQANDGETVSVTGLAWSTDLQEGEPDPIDDVTVEVDGSPLEVTHIAAHKVAGQSTFGFSASFIAHASHTHKIVARAVNEQGKSAVARRQVTTPPSSPLNATLSGVATLRTNFSKNGVTIPPLTAAETTALIFNGPRTTVSASFDDIVFPESKAPPGEVIVVASGTAEISSSAQGTFTKSTGQIGLPIRLRLEIRVIVIAGKTTIGDTTESSTLPVMLTTGTSVSPSGSFSLTGSPLVSSGAVTLVGTGSFSGGSLNGYDGALTCPAIISPVP